MPTTSFSSLSTLSLRNSPIVIRRDGPGTASQVSLTKGTTDVLPPLRFTPGKAIQAPDEDIRITPVPGHGPYVIDDVLQRSYKISPKLRSKDPALPSLPVSSDEETGSELRRTQSLSRLQVGNKLRGNFRDSI